MEEITSYYPAVVNLCKYLSFWEIKQLTLLSKDWRDVTNPIIINRGYFFLCPSITGSYRYTRKHKHGKVTNVDFQEVLMQLPDSLEQLEFDCIRNWSFKDLQRFKKLKRLNFDGRGFMEPVQPIPDDMFMRLEYLDISLLDEHLDLIQGFINRCPLVKILQLHFMFRHENKSEIFNDFLKNIHLPNLREFCILGYIEETARHVMKTCNMVCDDGLMEFFQNHRNLRVCELKQLSIKDKVVECLRRNCDKLEKVLLHMCLQLTGKTLCELQSMTRLEHLRIERINFKVEDMVKFKNTRQLKTFKYVFFHKGYEGFNNGLTTNQLKSMLNCAENMRVLDLSFVKGPESPHFKILPFIAERMPNLVELRLDGQNRISKKLNKRTEKEMYFGKLEKLTFYLSSITDTLLGLIRAPQLRELAYTCAGSSGDGLMKLVAGSPLINSLNIQFSYLDSHVWEFCLDNLPYLRKLNTALIHQEIFKKMVVETKVENSHGQLVCSIEGEHVHHDFATWVDGFYVDEKILWNGSRQFYFDCHKF